MVKFFRGPYASYVQATHGEGIYFATDKKVIKMGGVDYIGPLADATAVQSITLNSEGDKFMINYLDGTTSEIEVAKSEYTSNIEDKTLAMPNAVGGIAKGTKVSALEGKTFNEIFDDLLFPTVNPTFTAPSATIALRDKNTSVLEIGTQGPSITDFTTSFNAGAINLNGVKQNNRAGALDADSSFIYIDGDATDVLTGSPYEFNVGNNTFTYRAYYVAGPQPKDNKGNDYSTPLAAGYVDSKAVTVSGTYPWYASTATATSDNPVVKQALVVWNNTAGSMSTGQFTLQPSGTLSQVFKLPRQLKTLQMLNTVSGAMDTIGTSDYTETTEIINIGGTDVTYYVYTYKGSTRGEVTLLAKF